MVVPDDDAADARAPPLVRMGACIHGDPADCFGRAVRGVGTDLGRTATVSFLVSIAAGIPKKAGERRLVAGEPYCRRRTVPERPGARKPPAAHRRESGPRLPRVHLDERNGGTFGNVEEQRVEREPPLRIGGVRPIRSAAHDRIGAKRDRRNAVLDRQFGAELVVAGQGGVGAKLDARRPAVRALERDSAPRRRSRTESGVSGGVPPSAGVESREDDVFRQVELDGVFVVVGNDRDVGRPVRTGLVRLAADLFPALGLVPVARMVGDELFLVDVDVSAADPFGQDEDGHRVRGAVVADAVDAEDAGPQCGEDVAFERAEESVAEDVARRAGEFRERDDVARTDAHGGRGGGMIHDVRHGDRRRAGCDRGFVGLRIRLAVQRRGEDDLRVHRRGGNREAGPCQFARGGHGTPALRLRRVRKRAVVERRGACRAVIDARDAERDVDRRAVRRKRPADARRGERNVARGDVRQRDERLDPPVVADAQPHGVGRGGDQVGDRQRCLRGSGDRGSLGGGSGDGREAVRRSLEAKRRGLRARAERRGRAGRGERREPALQERRRSRRRAGRGRRKRCNARDERIGTGVVHDRGAHVVGCSDLETGHVKGARVAVRNGIVEQPDQRGEVGRVGNPHVHGRRRGARAEGNDGRRHRRVRVGDVRNRNARHRIVRLPIGFRHPGRQERRIALRCVGRGDPVVAFERRGEAVFVDETRKALAGSPLVAGQPHLDRPRLVVDAAGVLRRLENAVDVVLCAARRVGHERKGKVMPFVRGGDEVVDVVVVGDARRRDLDGRAFHAVGNEAALAEKRLLARNIGEVDPALDRVAALEFGLGLRGPARDIGGRVRIRQARADGSGDERDAAGRRAVVAGARGVHDVRLVHVPDALVAREGIVGADGLAARRGTPAHHELRPLPHRRERHPDERRAVRVPRVDLERKAVPGHVDEAQVGAALQLHLRIGEPVRRILGDPHEDREGRERGLGRVVAGDGQLRAPGVGRGGRARKRHCGKGEGG